MKRQYIPFLLAGLALVASCKKSFLDLYPEGSISEGNFFKSTADFQQAVTGAYVPLRDIATIAFFLDEQRSDNTHYDYNQKDRGGLGFEQLADFMDDAQNGVIGTRYLANFNGISRVNVVLDRIEKIAFSMAEADKKQIIGEAKALRAHYYFDLVRYFGAVPLHLHEVKDSKGAFLARTGVDSIYAQIISDFTDALALLAPPAKFPASGRMNKGTVATELALVYMTRKEFDKAVPLLQSVTTMGYDLFTNYRDIFNPANKASAGNKEAIFEVQYKSGTDGQSSNFIYRFIPVMPNTNNMLGIVFNNVNGGWNVPTDDLLGNYDPNDKRLNASIGIVEGKLNTSTDFVPDSVITNMAGYTPPAGSIAKRFVKKYFYPPYSLPGYNTSQNWPVYRLGGVLLLLAEALNETNRSGDALPHLNRVRFRAGLPDITTTDKAQLKTIIDKEKRLELAFENHRWMDLVRTEQAVSVMTAHGIIMKATYSYLLPGSYNVTKDRLIYAIPFRERQLNNKLTQNPGYN